MGHQAVSPVRVQAARHVGLFYPTMAVLAALIIFIGFAPTYYLRELFGGPALPLLLHLHGAAMTCWMALLIAQASLVAARRTDIHRRLGVFGGILAITIAVIGVSVAIRAARLGHAPAGPSPLAFLAIPLGDIFVFSTLVAAAFWYRKRPELHKRLMLVATIAILPPGLARWPFRPHGPLMFFGIADLILICCFTYDYLKTRRFSPAYLWGGLLLIASHPLRLLLSGTTAWMTFAHWITGV
jgi:hypothetical protein